MDQQRQQLVEKLKSANNILVTVSTNPSVDQLAAAIGLTLLLNKLKKHATAVFSGQVPSVLEFLKPEDTLETTTDSLRDFIISLDKSKADKLRYKVEENVVKIFITPYRSSISQDDLNYSQGDFNVDAVVALGVYHQQDLDQAIVAHGRILHDATVTTINTNTGGELGSINFVDPNASSLSELATQVAEDLGKEELDAQIATALLTGIVAETERFSNDKTTPETMRLSAELLTAGANQQLVASSLQVKEQAPESKEPEQGAPQPEARHKPDGTLEITHAPEPELPDVQVSDDGKLTLTGDSPESSKPGDAKEPEHNPEDAHDGISLLPPSQEERAHFMTEPPKTSGPLAATASIGSKAEDVDTSFNSLLPDSPKSGKDSEPPIIDKKPLRLEVPADFDAEAEKEAPAIILPDVVAPGTDKPQKSEEPKPPADKPAESITIPEIVLPPVAVTQPVTPPSQDTLESIEKMLGSPHSVSGAEPDAAKQPSDAPAPAAAPQPQTPLVSMPEPSPSPEPAAKQPQDVDAARSAVLNAINSTPVADTPMPAMQSVGASGYLDVQDLAEYDEASPPLSTLPPSAVSMPVPTSPLPPLPPLNPVPASASPADRPLDMPLPRPATSPVVAAPLAPAPPTQTPAGMPAPPPVPPPMTQLPPLL